jgi:hypothetical protein
MSNVFTETRNAFSESPDAYSCRGIVVYEDQQTRDRALRLCDELVRKFRHDLGMDFSWWRFDYLRDSDLAKLAADAAVNADIVVFSVRGANELPPPVRLWIDSWVDRQMSRPNALVALIGVADQPSIGLTPIHIYLREIARQAGMEYLSHLSDASTFRLDTSRHGIAGRAGEVTTLLDKMLHRASIPPRWGINE